MKTLTREMQLSITPEIALELLKEGNKHRYWNIKIFMEIVIFLSPIGIGN